MFKEEKSVLISTNSYLVVGARVFGFHDTEISEALMFWHQGCPGLGLNPKPAGDSTASRSHTG